MSIRLLTALPLVMIPFFALGQLHIPTEVIYFDPMVADKFVGKDALARFTKVSGAGTVWSRTG